MVAPPLCSLTSLSARTGAFLVLLLSACSGGARREASFDDDVSNTDPDASDTKNAFEESDSGTISTGEENLPSEVWGHSSNTLYKLDPTTKAVTVVGKFDGCSDIIDIALDESSVMYATTKKALYTIDKSSASCTKIADGAYPNSLSFVPKGTLDPDSEALVGFSDDNEYIRINTSTGDVTVIKADALGSSLKSSGDIVSVKKGGTYLTVKAAGNSGKCSKVDCLVKLNPATGQVLLNYGEIGHQEVFGLAYWAGKAYGFSSGGSLFEITFDGQTVKTSSISIADKPAGLSFWGAGSTTSAPIAAPTN